MPTTPPKVHGHVPARQAVESLIADMIATGVPGAAAITKRVDGRIAIRQTVEAIRAVLVSFGYTSIPRTTSTDSFATTANQTPVAGFANGGVANGFNDDVASGMLVSDWNYVNPKAVYQDTTATDKWRVDSGVITTDGTHPNLLGIGFGAKNAAFRAAFNILAA